MDQFKIIIADDDSFTRRALLAGCQKFCPADKKTIFLAENGKIAMQYFRQQIDRQTGDFLIVSDFRMPEMDGKELICEIDQFLGELGEAVRQKINLLFLLISGEEREVLDSVLAETSPKNFTAKAFSKPATPKMIQPVVMDHFGFEISTS